ncbi:MAG: chemotaxis protein CheB, partial [Spirochaetota bacterium]|nr:chemotaxis protein CheB [Spirochaetota bacterium]
MKNKNKSQETDITVVSLGASAGGLDAFKKFFTSMPSNSGIAFVLIQHLDPSHESLMVDLLARHTEMLVQQAKNNMKVKANNVYIIPPNKYMSIHEGVLRLLSPVERRGMRMPIDFFFRSLAEDRKEKAICIILSGTGSDGTLGLRTIKELGGMVMVQEPHEASYDGMPRSAINTG